MASESTIDIIFVSYFYNEVWLGRRTCNQQVASSNPARALPGHDSRQVVYAVHAHVPLPPSCIVNIQEDKFR